MKVDVRTYDGEVMTPAAATEPVGSALRVAPMFTATVVDDSTGFGTTVEAVYDPEQGRYVLQTIANRAIRRTSTRSRSGTRHRSRSSERRSPTA